SCRCCICKINIIYCHHSEYLWVYNICIFFSSKAA
ncbi:unnamed protein product, partial [Brassica napus]